MAHALLRASHPEPTVAVTAIAVGIAVSVGRPFDGITLVAAAVLAGQLFVGWLNDYLDTHRDKAVRRADKPVVTGDVSRHQVGVAALCAAVACIPLSLATGVLSGLVHLIAVLSATSYNLGLKASVASVLPYTVSFGLLPAFVVLTAAATPPWWLVTAGALLGSGAHFANAVPDVTDDLATGVHGLPQRLGRTLSSLVAAALLLAAMAVLVFGPSGPPRAVGVAMLCAAGVAFVVGAVAARRVGSRALFRAVMLSALLAVVLLVVST